MKGLYGFISMVLLGILILAMTSCGGRKVAEGELRGDISLSGAFALYPLAVQWAQEFQEENPGVRIDISAGGAGKGMTDVLANVVDMGMVSREIYPPESEKGAVGFAVAKDAVVATINAENPVLPQLLKKGLSREAAIKIWITGEAKTWGDVLGNGDQTPLHAYTRSDACGAAETWALWLGAKQEDLVGTAVYGDPGVASAVQRDIYGIGLNNIGYAYDNDTHQLNPGLNVLPIDGDGDGVISPGESFYETKDVLVKAIGDDKYPSPPARDLYMVTNGIPKDAAVVAFLHYILTKGQKYNVPAGYIEMSTEKVQFGLERLGIVAAAADSVAVSGTEPQVQEN